MMANHRKVSEKHPLCEMVERVNTHLIRIQKGKEESGNTWKNNC